MTEEEYGKAWRKLAKQERHRKALPPSFAGSIARKMIHEAAKQHGIKAGDIRGECTKKAISQIRKSLMKDIHDNTNLTLKEIGAIFNKRSPSVVRNLIDRA